MQKFLVVALALAGMTQGNRHMNGFDSHHGDHLVHESRVDPIDVGHHRTVPDYVGHEDRIDGHRTSEHHDSIHDKILPQDILEHPLGGAKYEGVHQAVKEDKGVWHDGGHHEGWHGDEHGHDGWHGDEHGHDGWHGDEHGHDGWHGDEHGPDGWHGDEHDHDRWHGHDGYEHGNHGHEHGHDLHANDFFDGVHGFHGHDWHGDDHHDDHHDGGDRNVLDHRNVHDNPHFHDYHH